jgi:hypothetical protein
MALNRSKAALIAVAMLVWAGHITLTFYFIAPSSLFSSKPLDGADYDTHIGQTYRVIEGLDRWGQSWVYDVQLLAGQPEGTIFDADNKGWELWTFLLWKLGLSKGQAFNSFVLVAHAMVPVLVACAASLFGLAAWTAVLAGAMASLLWFFDSWAHWTWWIGMVSYAFASVAFLVPLALFDRFVTRRSRAAGVAFVPVLALCHLLHPYSFFMLALPLAVIYLRSRRALLPADNLLVGLALLATVGLNAKWLLAAAQHWHYILDSGFFGQTGLNRLVADAFNLVRDTADSGVIGTRAGIRFAYLGMSLGSLVLFRRSKDPRFAAFASAFVALFGLAYFGSYLPFSAQIQPYRHVLPLSFIACLLAAAFVEQLVRQRALSGLPTSARALLGVCALAGVQHIAGDVMYFAPAMLPTVAPLIDGTPPPFTATGYASTLTYFIPRAVDAWLRNTEMAQWMLKNIPVGDRVLVEETHLGERVARLGGLEILGGFRQRNIAHSYANYFRHYENSIAPRDVVADYFRTYAVRWVVTHTKRADFEAVPELLEPLGMIEGRFIYRSRVPFDKVLHGGGSVSASTNRIEVRGSFPSEPVVLSYHFHERLVCSPNCTVVREHSSFDDVGLIRVPAPHPRDMVISLRY